MACAASDKEWRWRCWLPGTRPIPVRQLHSATSDAQHSAAITLPPLRERKEDIPALARHFLGEYFLARRPLRPKKQRPALTERAIDVLQSYPWPGNIRELQSVMERFAVLSEANILSVDAKWIPWESVQARTSAASATGMPLPNEAELLEAALLEMVAALPGWETTNLRE